MKLPLVRYGAVLSLTLVLAACGGSGGDPTPPPVTGSLKEKIAAAAANPANDTSTNSSASFVVLQDAGVPAASVKSPLKVNFAVFSDGKVVKGLTTSNMSLAIAKLVPGTNGDPDRWVNYVSRTENAKPGVGPGGAQVPPASAKQATTDPKSASQLVENDAGYYTYTFQADIQNPNWTATVNNVVYSTNGVTFEPSRTHRVAIQLSYSNAAGETIRVNPYLDFSFDAAGDSRLLTNPATQTRKMTDVASCNGCHEKLALHGGGRVDTQYCVMCHNPGTTDANSGNVLTLSTMAHKIHSGRLLKKALDEGKGGEDYTIWGFNNSKHDYAEVGFPQDLRNCTKCHSGDNPATPQGDNWKTQVSKDACLTCHANNAGSDWEKSHKPFAGTLVGPNAAAKDMSNLNCKGCHAPGSDVAPERVHWNQNEENSARYRFNIDGIRVVQVPSSTQAGSVEVKYSLTDPTSNNARYKLEGDSRFNGLRLYMAYQNLVGQSTAETEFTAYNNGGNNARVNANAGTNDGSNRYTALITVPANTATAAAEGTARIITYGAVSEPKLLVKSVSDPRPADPAGGTVNVVVQNTAQDFALTGALNPRRIIVTNEKCNVCHGALGTTSGSNTLANAFHGGSRNTVEACVMCHDANRMSSTVMTNGLALNESYQFKRMIHGIHGNSKRTYPFTHGNPVAGPFGKDGALLATGFFLTNQTATIGGTSTTVIPAGTTVASGTTFDGIAQLINTARANAGYTGNPAEAAENYAAEVAWPGVGINCNACHVNNSYKVDKGPIGAVVAKPAGVTDPLKWLVISPKAASCTACHDSAWTIGHVTGWGGAAYADRAQDQAGAINPPASGWKQEICADCHASGLLKGVDVVHNQK